MNFGSFSGDASADASLSTVFLCRRALIPRIQQTPSPTSLRPSKLTAATSIGVNGCHASATHPDDEFGRGKCTESLDVLPSNQSALAPEFLMTFPHFAVSALMYVPNCSGVEPAGSKSFVNSFWRVSGS